MADQATSPARAGGKAVGPLGRSPSPERTASWSAGSIALLTWRDSNQGGPHAARDGVLVAIGLVIGSGRGPPGRREVEQARDLWKVGKYAEALEAFDALAKKADSPPAVRDAIALGRADCLDSTGEPDKAIAALREVAEAPGQQGRQPRRLGPARPTSSSPGATGTAPRPPSKRALKAKPDHLLGRWVEARLLEARGEREKADRGLQVVRRLPGRPQRGARQGRRRPPHRRPGRREVHPGQVPRGGAERGAEQGHQQRLRGRPQGRPQLLAGPLARRPAVPLGLPGGGRPQGPDQGPPDQPARRRGDRHPRPGRLAGVQARRRPEEGRAGPGDQPPDGRRPGPPGRPEHLRRAVPRRPRRRQEGRRREPPRRGRPGPAGRRRPAPGRPPGGPGGRVGRPGEQPPARHLLRRPGRAAGRPPQVPLGRAGVPPVDRRRPRPRRHPDRPGDALHADRPRGRGPRPLRRRLRRRPVQRPRQEHADDPQAHGSLPADRLRALHRPGRPHPGQPPGQVHGPLPGVDPRRAGQAVRLRAAGPDPDRDHEGPREVQRPDRRPALHPDRRRLHRQGRRPGQPEDQQASRSTGPG